MRAVPRRFDRFVDDLSRVELSSRACNQFGRTGADASGNARLNWTGKLSLEGADSIIGKSLVVHEKEDDLKTDPAGNSGARIACGAIDADSGKDNDK